jgi:CHAT domain-containing protein
LQGGGRTLAVLAGGLSRIYPPDHGELAQEVQASGALLSEAAMTQEPLPGMFPARNRLISGLARAVVIVEASEKSGALITARHAAEQGREVFAKDPIDQALRQRLWEPLAKVLPAHAKQLVIAPDGELSLVPFEAIRLADGKYLVERFQIRYVSSGRDLMPRPGPKGKAATALLFADPDYDALDKSPAAKADSPARPTRSGDWMPKGKAFKPLPGFTREAEAVAKLLKAKGWNVQALQKGHASEEALAKVNRPRLLYFVTHGFFLPDLGRPLDKEGLRELNLVALGTPKFHLPPPRHDPRLRSGLALAGANRWKERSAQGLSDGLLTALEVENLDLWGTDLVVLSACETGLGQVQVGEGVLGLRRAFQLAGARTVLASLWKVPDAETEQLMTAFFQRWLKGADKAEALRAAQLQLIAQLRAGSSALDPGQRPGSPILEAPAENWRAVNLALYNGHRGLPGGSSLAKLLNQGWRGTR